MPESLQVSCDSLGVDFENGCRSLGFKIAVDPHQFAYVEQPVPRDRYVECAERCVRNEVILKNGQGDHAVAAGYTWSMLLPEMIENMNLPDKVGSVFFGIWNSLRREHQGTSECVRRLMAFVRASDRALIVGESVAPFTEFAHGIPKQPNRDHHLGHVLTVFVIGAFFLKSASGREILSKIRSSLIWASFQQDFPRWDCRASVGKKEADSEEAKDNGIEDIVYLAWLIASLCHDAAYPLEIGGWIAHPLRLGSWYSVLNGESGKGMLSRLFDRLRKPPLLFHRHGVRRRSSTISIGPLSSCGAMERKGPQRTSA